jgi:hypothetical protein
MNRENTKHLDNSIVISVFAIVILSAIGGMFASNHHSLMGSEEDPKDGKKVAVTVFGAVGIYGVSKATNISCLTPRNAAQMLTRFCATPGLPVILRVPGFPS